MITKYGMDPELGTLIRYDKDKSELYPFKPFSEKVAEQIDKKVKELVSTAYAASLAIIQKNRTLMDKMATLLLEKEYLTKEEFMAMMKDPSQIDALITEFKQKHSDKEEEKRKDREQNALEEKKKTTPASKVSPTKKTTPRTPRKKA